MKHARHMVPLGPGNVFRGLVTLLLLTGFLLAARVLAAPPSAHYLPAGPREVRIRVLVDRPPPAAIIVVQHLPPGVDVLQVEPPPAGFDRQRGVVRWLFRQPQPGRLNVTLHLSHPVPPNALGGDIRFRPPTEGATVVVPIGAGPSRPRRP